MKAVTTCKPVDRVLNDFSMQCSSLFLLLCMPAARKLRSDGSGVPKILSEASQVCEVTQTELRSRHKDEAIFFKEMYKRSKIRPCFLLMLFCLGKYCYFS